MTDHVGTIGRGGVVLAMSSGLVATMGLPAAAAAPTTDAPPATAPIAIQPAVALQSGLLSAAGSAQAATAELTAPAAANVSFESSAFKAVPKVSRSSTGGGSTSAGVSYDDGGFGSAKGSSVIAIAQRYLGVPYVYGGTTPSGWDCSGAVQYIFGQLGIDLPRTSSAQYSATRRISRADAVPGDLVFVIGSGGVNHVGIYAGGNEFYDAGRSGISFSKREIWTSSVAFGRV